MPRLNTNAEVLHRLTNVGVQDDASGGGSSTLSAGVAAGVSVLPFTAVTNFVATDLIRVGRTEWAKILSIASLNVTLTRPIEYAHPILDPVVETADVPIGDTTMDGFNWDTQTDETTVKVGTSRNAYLYIPGSIERTLTFQLLNFSLENLAEVFGLNPTSRITGAGTSGNPYILSIDPANFHEQPVRNWFFESLREDGKLIRAEFWQSKVYAAQAQIKVVTGEPTNVPFRLRTVGITKIFHY